MQRVVQVAIAMVFALAGTIASANTVQSVVADCIRATGAPGTYSIDTGQSVPQVTPDAGGTSKGAIYVNDCLLDRYQVQFGKVAHVAVPPSSTRSDQNRCQRLLNRGRGDAFFRSVGTSLLAGGLGAGIHASTVTANFQDCIRSGAYSGTGISAANGTAMRARNCGRNSSVFKGGRGYCVD